MCDAWDTIKNAIQKDFAHNEKFIIIDKPVCVTKLQASQSRLEYRVGTTVN